MQIGGISSWKHFQSLASPRRKSFWMVGTTWGIKISVTSSNNSTSGSKIREKLSKKWAHDFMQEEKCGWGYVARAARERKPQYKSMEATYVKPSACFGTAVLRTRNIVLGKVIPEPPTVSLFQQIYLISWWCLCGHNFCFLSSHSYLLSHVWPERNKVQVRARG